MKHDSAEVRQVVEEMVPDLFRDLVPVSHRHPPPGTVMLTSACTRVRISNGHRGDPLADAFAFTIDGFALAA